MHRLKMILPLTIISFLVVTKWWLASIVDVGDEVLYGFPWPFVCSGWHTSLSLQFFVTEFVLDFGTYLLFWGLVLYAAERFGRRINPSRRATRGLWLVASVLMLPAALIVSMPEHVFSLKRDFAIQVKSSGYHLLWQHPDLYDKSKR